MGKTSKVKKNNQKRTKLSKQGKLKHKRHKKTVVKSKQPAKPIRDEEDEESEESDHGEDMLNMVDEDDLAFLVKAVQGGSYTMLDEIKKKKRKFEDDENVENEYEKNAPVENENKKTRHLLPIKSSTGIIRRAVFEDVNENEVEAKRSNKTIKSEGKQNKNDDLVQLDDILDRDLSQPLSVVDMLAWREEAIAKYKLRIGLLSSGLLENPEQNVMNITRLLEIFDEWHPELQVTLKKLVMVSLLEVFKDILPSYQIKHQEETNKLKKDTRELQTYEKRLLKGYKLYLAKLEKFASKLYRKKGDTRVFTKHDIMLGELAVKCLCQLLSTHPYFNFGKNIVVLLTPYLDNKNTTVRTVLVQTFTEIFTTDKRGEITLEIVRRINDLVKKKQHSVKCEVISVLTSLRLSDLNADDPTKVEADKKKILAKKSRIMNLSKRERKKKKRLEEVEKELMETKAEENKTNLQKIMTDVTKYVFTIYFRILKNAPSSGLLSTALEGLAKFAHCINLDFYQDLVVVLNSLVENGDLKVGEKLHCQLTVFTILSGHGEAFNIDPNKFYKHLYSTMLQVSAGKTGDLSPVLIKCLDKVILGRRKKLTYQQLLGFIKRVATISLQQNHNVVLALLMLLKQIFQYNSSVDCLLDMDSGVGQGIYLPELNDPEHCNASSTSLYELVTLQRHYHPIVRKLARHVAAGVPSGDSSLNPDIAKLTCMEILTAYDPGQVAFNPVVPPPKKINSSKKKKIVGDIKDNYLSSLSNKILSKELSCDFTSLWK